MSGILLAPHNDDESLFASYTLMREKPLVVVCFYPVRQERDGIFASDRIGETSEAMAVLGCDFEQWSSPDNLVEVPLLGGEIMAATDRYDHCWAPLPEPDGHEQHNLVGQLAVQAFGVERTTFYATYRRGYARTETGVEVVPWAGWRALKLRALSCYSSQIDLPATRPWFTVGWDREWVLPAASLPTTDVC